MPVDELRSKLLDGFIPFGDFAAALNKHPKTVMRMNPPLVRIGRDVYVPEEQGRAWLLNGCKPQSPPSRRGRQRAA
jgi:hypothetical protein